jgi:endogenous inhibitor of DNA gyrase (YacG/DUF329 family)
MNRLEAMRAREQAATPGLRGEMAQGHCAGEIAAPCPCCGLVASRPRQWYSTVIEHFCADMSLLLDLAEAVDVWYRAFENNEVTESDAWEDMSDALGRVREDVPA